MALNSLNAWNDSFNTQILPTMGDYVTPFQNWLSSEANNLKLASAPSSFIFNAPAFGSAISGLSLGMDKSVGLQIFADAWETAVSASTMTVSGGTAIVTNASAVKSIVYNIMFNSDISQQSALPEAMRTGFLSLIYTVTIFGTPPAIFPSGTI